MTLAVLAALSLALWTTRPAMAVNASMSASGGASASIWTVDGATVRVRMMIPTSVARRLVPANAPAPALATVASAISQGVSVTTPAGDCEAVDQGEGVGQVYTLALTPGLDRFEMVFTCPQTSGLVLKDSILFDRDPTHIDFAQIRVGSAQPVLQAFTREHQAVTLPAADGALHDIGPMTFVRLGTLRLATSLSASAIVLGSVLLSRRWLDLAWLAGVLAFGYAASVAVALTGLVALDQGLAETEVGVLTASLGLGVLGAAVGDKRWPWGAWVGLGVVLVGLIVAAAFRGPAAAWATAGVAVFGLGALRASREPRLGMIAFAPAGTFAFMSGLARANDLTLLHPAAGQLAPVLVSHDLGGFAAAMAGAAAAMGLIWLAGRWVRGWRSIGSELAGAGLIGQGLFWFVSRLYS